MAPSDRGPSERDAGAPGLGEPDGFLVAVDEVDRIHFLDWRRPDGAASPVLLIHGLAGNAWTWAPVARRLRGTHHVVAEDLRGHGLSDAPTSGYRPDELATDSLAVAEGAGLLDAGSGLLVAGHGFGAIVAAWLARRLGAACAGLVLVDGGWEHPAEATGLEPDELLRALEEPPEVLQSMAAWLADRAAFDPDTWDADQERAARTEVIELPAGRVVSVTRPHVLAGCVAAMYEHQPFEVLAAVEAPISALLAAEDETGSRRPRLAALNAALRAGGRPGLRAIDLSAWGHNLMRYRPDAVAAAIQTARDVDPAYHPGS
jgi:pimeloyl-ACP methyl ester carboxylesterase